MLQAILAAVSVAALIAAVAAHGDAETGQTRDVWNALGIGAYACACLALARAGHYRWSASLAVIGSLLLIGAGYYLYGLQAQPDLLMIHLLPLLLAGLLLGRAAVWWVALGSAVSLALGAWSDAHAAMHAWASPETWSSLFLSGMNFLVLATILDRLILSSQRAMARSRELDAAYRELQRTMDEKERAYARLLEAQRMEAIGRLSTGVAHDFNHILSVILGLAGAPASNGGPDATLSRIEQAARRGTILTRRLLSFSRPQSRDMTVFDLGEAIDDMSALIAAMFPPRVKVQVDLSAGDLLVRADRDELELALLNLAANASDAMPGEGQFKLSASVDGTHALIRVEDSGVGMTPDVLSHAFTPFFTTKPRGEGTGIGLSIVHRFVADCCGSIAMDSRPGGGTRIAIRLPPIGDMAATA
jgi:signal transduction histidine kinase